MSRIATIKIRNCVIRFMPLFRLWELSKTPSERRASESGFRPYKANTRMRFVEVRMRFVEVREVL